MAYNSKYNGIWPTVNILNANPTGAANNSLGTWSQLNATQALTGIHKTVMVGPTGSAGLPTIVIPGYTGPA
jgi:hypothetical protein